MIIFVFRIYIKMTENDKSTYKRKKPSYFMSILGVALVLFILGLLGWIVINTSKLENYFKGSVQLHAFIREGSPQKDIDSLESAIKNMRFARDVIYITKDMARQRFIGDNNEDWNKVLDFNPLPASVDFYLNPEYVNKDSLVKVLLEVKQYFIVSEVKYPDAVVNSLNSLVKKIELILLFIALVFAIIVIVLIDNTIKLAMFSNRFIIKTMQMVGATRWFIAKPFDKKAILNGLTSAVLAILAILTIIYSLETWWLPELKALKDNLLLSLLFFFLIIIGIGITLFSTHRSVMKYLKTKLDDLY
jgi:cell division transport system permease protein